MFSLSHSLSLPAPRPVGASKKTAGFRSGERRGRGATVSYGEATCEKITQLYSGKSHKSHVLTISRPSHVMRDAHTYTRATCDIVRLCNSLLERGKERLNCLTIFSRSALRREISLGFTAISILPGVDNG